ncbi:hypothetical protein [Salimicrobium halophilum]|uniref:Uncharacterized protein n=1 Tax=Salimicrobium halophilum TaxID=86666 RepID=A0A1G8WDX9_9BACI|nr:hypothetical protein [Salimicrobium halophilum]SDJ76451.1 hypothetical protein SAMN04490247_3142 [Salimicrobium halophilum]
MNELEKHRFKRLGKLTPDELIEDITNQEGVEKLVCVAMLEDGTVVAGWSANDQLHVLGMLEYAKACVTEEE